MEKFKALSVGKQVASVIASLFVVGSFAVAGTNPTKPPVTAPPVPSVSPAVTTRTAVETKEIDFTTTNENDGTLTKGQTRIKVIGKKGIETLTYRITSNGGIDTGKSLISDEVTTPPINQVFLIGTYEEQAVAPSCGSNTYVNSSGNCVQRPTAAPQQPAGATAQCVDGSYSFSQHRSGTCSYHGGVARWL
jgi:hypothetical protein